MDSSSKRIASGDFEESTISRPSGILLRIQISISSLLVGVFADPNLTSILGRMVALRTSAPDELWAIVSAIRTAAAEIMAKANRVEVYFGALVVRRID